MYQSLKKIFHFVFHKKTLFRIEPFLRNCYAINKSGKNNKCTICDFEAKTWITISNSDNLCPKCGSLSRDRRLWKLISEKYLQENISILDFSPSRSLFRKWKKVKNVNYTASDLSGDFISDVTFDITNISQDDNTHDLIICYHILEHVIDDQKAMQELFRILKPNGTILIQTPFKEGKIYEDYTITSESERLLHFGQEDHVRVYSTHGLKKRLENAGFSVIIKQFDEEKYLGLTENEIILIANK
jgi:ubiquinone/menaquinone biosynthesis C-methylase UbiE